MIIVKKAEELRAELEKVRQGGLSIGFVPTMGALHNGHISLIEASEKNAGFTVCSIFVNPAQFNDASDFDKYPVTTSADIELLDRNDTDALYLPQVVDVYPTGIATLEKYDLGSMELVFEGKYRPGHFQGVCQVMRRLLQLVQPDHLFMGQKDYQQCMVVKKLLALLGMQEQVRFHVCPTVRESTGLAMSSRNMRLTPSGRDRAVAISSALSFLKSNIQPGDLESLVESAKAMLHSKNIIVDYLAIADADSLELVTRWNGQQPLVALAAGFVDDVRLIDNMIIN